MQGGKETGPHIAVVEPGLCTTVQDFGRHGHQALGLPTSGALDLPSLRVANALAGNPEDTAALEMIIVGPVLSVEAESVRLALVGTESGIELLSDPPRRIPPRRSVRLVGGDRFRIAPLRDSACAYLAIEGGLRIPPVFGSRSTYMRGGFGGFAGRALRVGDRLPLMLDGVSARPEREPAVASEFHGSGPIRLVLGPQDDYFTAPAIQVLLRSEYVVTAQSDRMGLRLAGEALEHSRGHDIPSDGIATGSVQVPGNGLPIILLADHQTTGGYPKVATVASVDVPRLGRSRPGDRLRFCAVSVDEAVAARREQEEAIRSCLGSLREVDGRSQLEKLLSVNLISGVVAAE